MNERPGYRLLPNLKDHKCFGCSPSNPAGLRMRFFSRDDAVFSWVTIPEHLCGWHHLAHGGAVAAVLDEIMGRAAVYLLNRLILTKTIGIDFLKPVWVGREVRAEGRILRRPSEREALIEGFVFDSDNVLCARGRGTFALFTPEALLQRGDMDPKLVNDLKALFSGRSEEPPS